jgi:hypothetical protein
MPSVVRRCCKTLSIGTWPRTLAALLTESADLQGGLASGTEENAKCTNYPMNTWTMNSRLEHVVPTRCPGLLTPLISRSDEVLSTYNWEESFIPRPLFADSMHSPPSPTTSRPWRSTRPTTVRRGRKRPGNGSLASAIIRSSDSQRNSFTPSHTRGSQARNDERDFKSGSALCWRPPALARF